ncbi:MAG: hypothetical protein ACYS99_17200 [Planctomycetota bacterium]|jgi:hypothetical protein
MTRARLALLFVIVGVVVAVSLLLSRGDPEPEAAPEPGDTTNATRAAGDAKDEPPPDIGEIPTSPKEVHGIVLDQHENPLEGVAVLLQVEAPPDRSACPYRGPSS